MKIDRQTSYKLKKYADIFRDARERAENEENTVQYLMHFFEDVLGYSFEDREITMEYKIHGRFVDMAIVLDGKLKFLVEAKAASHKSLNDRDMRQAKDYAAELAVPWVLLTNGIDWKLYHLTFDGEEGIKHRNVLSFNFVDLNEQTLADVWQKVRLLSKAAIKKDELGLFLDKSDALSPSSLIKALSAEKVLNSIRRELYKSSKTRVTCDEIVESLNGIICPESHDEGGEVIFKKARVSKPSLDESKIQIKMIDPTYDPMFKNALNVMPGNQSKNTDIK